MRAVFSFFSILAFGVMSAAALVAIAPWLSGRAPGSMTAAGPVSLHFESILLGVVLGVLLGTLSRYNWVDVPRRIVAWFLIRERQFFYYALIVGGLGILLFY